MACGPNPVQIDPDGTKWWRWLYEYDWEGDRFCFDIVARSQDEADARLKRLPLARFVGQGDGAPIPFIGGGFFVPLVVWWRNLRNMSGVKR